MMEILFSAFVFILGIIIGSFLNVVILRYNSGLSINGRSKCFSCSKTLAWYELIPVFSFLFQKGKCRKCFSKVSLQYPLVELATGVVFLALYKRFIEFSFFDYSLATTDFILLLVITSILIVIFVYDLRHKIIPDGLSYAFAVFALIRMFLLIDPSTYGTLITKLNFLAGPILFLPFYLLWKFSKGKWIGLGDGKLAVGIGWMLGFIYGLSAIVLAFWIGAAFSIALLLILRLKNQGSRITMKTVIPFAPFMILGAMIVFFFGLDVLSLELLFNTL